MLLGFDSLSEDEWKAVHWFTGFHQQLPVGPAFVGWCHRAPVSASVFHWVFFPSCLSVLSSFVRTQSLGIRPTRKPGWVHLHIFNPSHLQRPNFYITSNSKFWDTWIFDRHFSIHYPPPPNQKWWEIHPGTDRLVPGEIWRGYASINCTENTGSLHSSVRSEW